LAVWGKTAFRIDSQTAFFVYKDTSTQSYVTPLGTVYDGKGAYHGHSGDTGIFNTTYTDPKTLNGDNFRNGSDIGNGTATPRPDDWAIDAHIATGPLAQGARTVGADNNGGTNREINGGIAEILLYDRALTAVELDDVGNYLEGRYGITWNDVTTPAPAGTLDLADVIGGGDGASLAVFLGGIDKLSGATVTAHAATHRTGTGFHAAANSLVDGIGVPDGGSGGGPVQYNTLGNTIVLPDTNNDTWDHALNQPSASGFSTLSGVDYNNTGGHTMIDVHANTLVTFDLDAIEAAHGGVIDGFTAVAGGPNAAASGSMEYRVYLDGVLKDSGTVTDAQRTQGFPVNVAIAPGERFLTLVALDLSGGIGSDQFIFGDPRLSIIPEPHAAMLAWCGALGALLLFRRRPKT